MYLIIICMTFPQLKLSIIFHKIKVGTFSRLFNQFILFTVWALKRKQKEVAACILYNVINSVADLRIFVEGFYHRNPPMSHPLFR